MNKSNKNTNLSGRTNNIIEFSPKETEYKAAIVKLNEYRNKIRQCNKNYGSFDDLDESNYINIDDDDFWDK